MVHFWMCSLRHVVMHQGKREETEDHNHPGSLRTLFCGYMLPFRRTLPSTYIFPSQKFNNSVRSYSWKIARVACFFLGLGVERSRNSLEKISTYFLKCQFQYRETFGATSLPYPNHRDANPFVNINITTTLMNCHWCCRILVVNDFFFCWWYHTRALESFLT